MLLFFVGVDAAFVVVVGAVGIVMAVGIVVVVDGTFVVAEVDCVFSIILVIKWTISSSAVTIIVLEILYRTIFA